MGHEARVGIVGHTEQVDGEINLSKQRGMEYVEEANATTVQVPAHTWEEMESIIGKLLVAKDSYD